MTSPSNISTNLPVSSNIKIPFIPNLLTFPFHLLLSFPATTLHRTHQLSSLWDGKLPPSTITSNDHNSFTLSPPSQFKAFIFRFDGDMSLSKTPSRFKIFR